MKDFICKLYYHLYLPDTSRFCEVSILFLSFMKWKKRENLNSYLMCKKFKYEIPYGEFLCTLLYYEHHVGSVAECLGHWACNLVVPGASPSPLHPFTPPPNLVDLFLVCESFQLTPLLWGGPCISYFHIIMARPCARIVRARNFLWEGGKTSCLQ